MRQRLQIARALAVEPKVLLMDEPFAALDALTRRRMHDVLLDIWQRIGKTIVFVTHDIAEAISLADRIAVMSVGPRSDHHKLIDLDLPRPRDLTNPKVAQLFNEIEALLAPDLIRSERATGGALSTPRWPGAHPVVNVRRAGRVAETPAERRARVRIPGCSSAAVCAR